MKHASTRAVHAYWNERRGNRPAPGRDDIDPVAIRHGARRYLPAVGGFRRSASLPSRRHAHLRLVLPRAQGRDPRRRCGARTAARPIDDILAIVTDENGGVVTGLTGHADDGATAIWKCCCCRSPAGDHARTSVLGVLAPMTPVYWIGAKPIVDTRTQYRASSRRRTAPSGCAALCTRRLTVANCGMALPSTAAPRRALDRTKRMISHREFSRSASLTHC